METAREAVCTLALRSPLPVHASAKIAVRIRVWTRRTRPRQEQGVDQRPIAAVLHAEVIVAGTRPIDEVEVSQSVVCRSFCAIMKRYRGQGDQRAAATLYLKVGTAAISRTSFLIIAFENASKSDATVTKKSSPPITFCS